MITLYTTPPLWRLPSISPLCMELETWLRMAKLPYRTLTVTALDLAAAPKGKIPFIEYQGKRFSDSTLIIEMLKEKEGIDLDAGLTSTERAISLAFRRMVKENIYWEGVHIREENWQVYRKASASMLLPKAPAEEWEPFIEEWRENILTQMYSHGMGRHSREEICQLIRADFQALSDFLADKPFFMGQPTTLDATAYGYIGNIIKPPLRNPMTDDVLQRSNLCQHYERMTQQFFSEVARESSLPVLAMA